MNIGSFDDLLCAAREQPEPQRLLFVFAAAVLPDDCTVEQRARFAASQGGALAPLMSVDKDPDTLGGFSDLVEESRQFGPHWAVVFVAGLSGRGGHAPSGEEADRCLTRMVESIKQGAFSGFIPFDRQGHPMLFD